MESNQLENYLTLLTIRRAGRHRDTIISGAAFLLSFVTLIALGMLDRLNGRSLYLASALAVSFGFSYLMAWTKLEAIKGSIELIDNLLLMNRGKGHAQ